jgi:hypothetical protein
MRSILLAMTLITAASPIALAQGFVSTTKGPTSNQSYSQAPTSQAYSQPSAMPESPPPTQPPATTQRYGMASTGGGENCGTPEEFKACPPLPRHPLPYYPPNRPDCGSCRVQ